MRESPFIQYCLEEFSAEAAAEAYKEGVEQGKEQGIEQGEKKGTIQNIMALLERQFQPDAVQVLKPTLEGIDDLPRLRELLLAAPQVESLETFMRILANGNAIESENGAASRSERKRCGTS